MNVLERMKHAIAGGGQCWSWRFYRLRRRIAAKILGQPPEDYLSDIWDSFSKACADLEASHHRAADWEARYNKTAEDCRKLQGKCLDCPGAPHNIREILASIMAKTLAALRADNRFDIRVSEAGDWEVVTQYCALGGCDMELIQLPTERDALILAAALDALGYQMSHNTACHACYADYMQDCG